MMRNKLTIYPRNAASDEERKIIFAVQRVMRENMTAPLRIIALAIRRELQINPRSSAKVIRPRIRGRRNRVNVYSRHPIRKQPWAIMASVHTYND